MKTINDFAVQSRLAHVTPEQKICFGVIALVLSLWLSNLLTGVFLIIFFFFFSTACSGVSKKQYLTLLMIPSSFLLLGVLPILLTLQSSELAWFSIPFLKWHLSCTPDSAKQAAELFVKALAAVSCMYFLPLTTTMTDLLQGFKRFRVPALLLTLMELIYRYIFVLFEEAQKIKTAQRSRLGYHSFKTSLQSAGQLIAALFLRSYTRCDRVYNALLSRGYEGTLNTLGGTYQKSRTLNLLLLAVCLCMALLMWLGGALGWN